MEKFTFYKESIENEYIIFGDEQGYFNEAYHKEVFSQVGHGFEFVQLNPSKSKNEVFRGLDFQYIKYRENLYM